jgi:hypothetical protein
MADTTTVHWEAKESSLTRSSFNSIVSRKQANVSEMMIKHTNMGRQAEMGPDWKPAAIITIQKAQGGAIPKKPGIPGLTAPRSSPAPSPVVKTVVPASQMGGTSDIIGSEDPAPSELQALRANLAPEGSYYAQADSPAALSASMFRSSSSPTIRGQNALSWASKERRTPTSSKPTPPKLQRTASTPLQAAAVAQLDDGGRSREKPKQLPRFESGLEELDSSKPKRWPTPRHSVAEAELSAMPGQQQREEPAVDPGRTVHWSASEQSLNRDSFNKIVSRSRFDATESMMRHTAMSRQAVLGPTWSPPGLVTREIAKKIAPVYNNVPFAG